MLTRGCTRDVRVAGDERAIAMRSALESVQHHMLSSHGRDRDHTPPPSSNRYERRYDFTIPSDFTMPSDFIMPSGAGEAAAGSAVPCCPAEEG